MVKILFLLSLTTALASQGCLSTHTVKKFDDRFGVLVFLPWNDDWNKFMYPEDKAIQAMDLIQEAGIQWVRMDFSRTKVEPNAEGQFEFEHFDWLVKELRKRDIAILGVLGYSPPWAAADGKWDSPPKDIKSFGNYVYETVHRYKGKVAYWEIWNEPNDVDYWPQEIGLEAYVPLLKESYQAAKSANPQCVVLNGGLANLSADHLKKLYVLGAKNYFDIVNIHLIDDAGSEDFKNDIMNRLVNIKNVMDEFNDGDKKIWLTEIGSSGIPDSQEGFTEERQEKVLKETLSSVIDSGQVKKVFWAFFQDTTKFFNLKGIDQYGLIRADFSKKPAYYALKELIRREKIPGR